VCKARTAVRMRWFGVDVSRGRVAAYTLDVAVDGPAVLEDEVLGRRCWLDITSVCKERGFDAAEEGAAERL